MFQGGGALRAVVRMLCTVFMCDASACRVVFHYSAGPLDAIVAEKLAVTKMNMKDARAHLSRAQPRFGGAVAA